MENDNAGVLPEAAGVKEPPAALRRFDYLLEDIGYLFHEIRTPLTVIIASAEFAGSQPDPAARQTLLDNIRKEALRIDNLLNDFSQIYRHETGTWLTETVFSRIDVGDLLREAVIRFCSGSSGHSIRLEISPDLPPVRGEWEKLYLVLRNLLANAIKYSPHGGEVCLSAAADGRGVTISVRDHGIGIPAECLQSIFDRGVRVAPAGCRQTRGSGLGLTMVKRIVEGHNGTVRVESTEGEGSTFSFSLPVDGGPPLP